MAIRESREKEFNLVMSGLKYALGFFTSGTVLTLVFSTAIIGGLYRYLVLFVAILLVMVIVWGIHIKYDNRLSLVLFIGVLMFLGEYSGDLSRFYGLTPSEDSLTLWIGTVAFVIVFILMTVRYRERGVQKKL